MVLYQINGNPSKKKITRRRITMKNNLSKMAAKKITSAMNVFLRIDANSTSCTVLYQPKEPKGLSKFRRIK